LPSLAAMQKALSCAGGRHVVIPDGLCRNPCAADLLDDVLQVVQVCGDPVGEFWLVAAAALGDLHGQTDREQLLDDVVTQVRFGSWPAVWSGVGWCCLACAVVARGAGRGGGRAGKRGPVAQSQRVPGCVVSPCRRAGMVPSGRGPDRWRRDPLTAWWGSRRLGCHVFHDISRCPRVTESNGLSLSPDVPDRVAQVLERGPDGGWW